MGIFGIIVIAMVIGAALLIVGQAIERDSVVGIGFSILATSIILLFIALGIALINSAQQRVLAGHCYRVQQESITYDFVEIVCPS